MLLWVRFAAVALVLCAAGCSGCKRGLRTSEATGEKDAERLRELTRLKGTWAPDDPDPKFRGVALTFHGHRVFFRAAEGIATGTFHIDPVRTPGRIRVSWAVAPHLDDEGTYFLDGDRLSILLPHGPSWQRPQPFAAWPGPGGPMLFKRVEFVPLPEDRPPIGDALARLVVGRWRFAHGDSNGGLLALDTEFTADGCVRQMAGGVGEAKWAETHRYRAAGAELILTPLGKPAAEVRVRVAAITDEKLVTESPAGLMLRTK